MSDHDLTEPVEGTPSGSSRERRSAEKAAKLAALRESKDAKAAAKQEAKDAKLAALRESKDAKAAAKQEVKDAKASKAAAKNTTGSPMEDPNAEKPEKAAKPAKVKKEKVEKDPHRPRFAVADRSVRVLVVVGSILAVIGAATAAAATLLAGGSLEVGPLADVPEVVLYAAAAAAALSSLLWVFAAVKLSAGLRVGLVTGWIAWTLSVLTVVGLPLALVALFMLLSRDTRDWAL